MKANPSIFIGTVIMIAGTAAVIQFKTSRPVAGMEPIIHAPFDSNLIDSQIANSERVVATDPGGALGWSFLSSAYMGRSRESDDLTTAIKAETAARKSLALRKLGNSSGWDKLVQSLLQQHRFKDALAECKGAVASGNFDDQTMRLQADCFIEVGDYASAFKLFRTQNRAFEGAAGQAIVARWLDINGQPSVALRRLQSACAEADLAPAMPGDAIAWFHVRVAAQEAKMGRHAESQAEYLKALALYPRDYKAMAGLSRLAFQDQRWNDAIDWGKRSDAIAQMADVRAMVGDAYDMKGDRQSAENQYAQVAILIGRPSGINEGLHEVASATGTHGHRLDRQYAIYCADHHRDADGAYGAAIRDFGARRDIYAYDTLAWVCLQRGNVAEAKLSIVKAMSTGAQDPNILYHAGCIYRAAGDTLKSRSFLTQALKIDPKFDGVAVIRAREFLKEPVSGRSLS